MAYKDNGIDYGNNIVNEDVFPTMTSPYTFTAGDNQYGVFISAWRIESGYTLKVYVNNANIYEIPANTPGMVGLYLRLYNTQTLQISTDKDKSTWQCRIRIFKESFLI